MPATVARLLFLALLVPFSLPALALDDTEQNREEQANRYLEAVPPQAMLNDMSSKMAETLPAGQRDEFKTLMTKFLDAARVTSAIRAAMVKTFSAGELKALADFYGSDVGKSAMAKMGTYMAEVMPATMNEVQAALSKAQEEAHEKGEAPGKEEAQEKK